MIRLSMCTTPLALIDNRLNFELQENYCKGNISRLDFLDSMDYNESGVMEVMPVKGAGAVPYELGQ